MATTVDPDVSPLPFSARHIGAPDHETDTMLATLGFESMQQLVDAALPASIAQPQPLNLPPALDEAQALEALRSLAAKNELKTQMIGQGFYGTHTPSVILRNVLENPGWYTAYTPYQPEISQGRLEALLNFQTMVSDLTGMDIANASLLDESSAVAEAILLMRRSNKKLADAKVVVDADVFPQTREVVTGRAEAVGISVEFADLRQGLPAGRICGLVVQTPGDSGAVVDHSAVIAEAKERGAMVTVAADLLSLTLLSSPGELGRTSRWAVASASGFRCSSAARMRPIWRCARGCSGSCPAGWWGSPRTPRAGPATGWRCRLGSSTSAVSGRRRTSVLRRRCWRWSPPRTGSTTAPTG